MYDDPMVEAAVEANRANWVDDVLAALLEPGGDPLGVACPWGPCGAGEGEPCADLGPDEFHLQRAIVASDGGA